MIAAIIITAITMKAFQRLLIFQVYSENHMPANQKGCGCFSYRQE
jgi:hypothetical protein